MGKKSTLKNNNKRKSYIKRCYFTERHEEFDILKGNIIEMRNRIFLLENKVKKLETENEFINLDNYILNTKK